MTTMKWLSTAFTVLLRFFYFISLLIQESPFNIDENF